jgi:DNA polymerase III delta prime subunit
MVIAASLTHLFSCANIPQGLAHTTALKENFYCVVLCAINKWPLLITGPPGCGKTLSFILACDTLRGRCPTHSVAFQSIVQAKKITYQCSIQSTGPEIAAVFNDAHMKQEFFEAQQPGRNLCLVGLDEAGLTPENRQALKSTHDFLGEHHNDEIDRIVIFTI